MLTEYANAKKKLPCLKHLPELTKDMVCILKDIFSVEKSNDGDIVDFIFSKDASRAKYDSLLVEDNLKSIPESIKDLISDNFYNNEPFIL